VKTCKQCGKEHDGVYAIDDRFCSCGCHEIYEALQRVVNLTESQHYNTVSIFFDPCICIDPKCVICGNIHFPAIDVINEHGSASTIICETCLRKKILGAIDRLKVKKEK